jgi:hypothetical protein
MKNLHARKECVSDRSWIVFKVLYCRLGYGVEITLQVFHFLALTCGRPPRRLHGPERWGRCCVTIAPGCRRDAAHGRAWYGLHGWGVTHWKPSGRGSRCDQVGAGSLKFFSAVSCTVRRLAPRPRRAGSTSWCCRRCQSRCSMRPRHRSIRSHYGSGQWVHCRTSQPFPVGK